MKKVCKVIIEDWRSTFQRWLEGYASCVNMLPNPNRGLEHAADLSKICASVAHQQAETVVIFDGWKKLLCFPTLVIHLISPHVISCFWEWNCGYEVVVSRTSMKLVRITENFTCYYKKSVSAVLPAVAETLTYINSERKYFEENSNDQ